MDSRQKWLNDLRAYESSIRNKQVKYLCNKKDIEQMRFALRVLLDDATRPTKYALDAALVAPAEPDSGSGIVPAGEVDSQPRQ